MAGNVKKNELMDYRSQYADISNELARAREKVTLMESKIELLAISRLNSSDLKTLEKEDVNGKKYSCHYVEINTSEIRALMGGRKDGHVYEETFKAAVALARKLYIIEDRESRQFNVKTVFEECPYSNGTLRVVFKPEMEKHFLNISEGYTHLNLGICFGFKYEGSLLLYRNLKSIAYTLPPINYNLDQEELPSIPMHYSLTDLRMHLGFVDIEQTKLAEEARKARPNWEKMAAAEKSPKYSRFSDLERRILTPGIEEINNTSDIYVTMDKETGGRGGKIIGVTFHVRRNKNYETSGAIEVSAKVKSVLSEEQKDDFIDELREIIDLKTKELKAIAEAAEYDLDRVKKAVKVAESTPKIDNYMGFLLKAIKEDWDMPKSKQKNAFNEYKQNVYDYEELESRLIAN